jgi:thiol-disulfide isomerase/thioredoxin
MITCCALSLFFLSWFSNDDNLPAKDQEKVAEQESVDKLDKAMKSMSAERAVEIMLECGFVPQLPAFKLPSSTLKVQKNHNQSYERVNIAGSQKKPTIVHFWATWCGPCKRELPEFSLFSAKVKEKINVYTVTSELKNGSNDEAKMIWDFYQSKNIKYLNVTADENNNLANTLGVTGIPVTFLIDSNGRVIGQFLGANDWSKTELIAAILTILK